MRQVVREARTWFWLKGLNGQLCMHIYMFLPVVGLYHVISLFQDRTIGHWGACTLPTRYLSSRYRHNYEKLNWNHVYDTRVLYDSKQVKLLPTYGAKNITHFLAIITKLSCPKIFLDNHVTRFVFFFFLLNNRVLIR